LVILDKLSCSISNSKLGWLSAVVYSLTLELGVY